jgi:hypothetical protein
MNTAKSAFMTVVSEPDAWKTLCFSYVAEQENVLLPKGANTLTSGTPAYKRARVPKVAEKAQFQPADPVGCEKFT